MVAGGPRGNLLRALERAGIAVADLELHTVEGQHESVVSFVTRSPTDSHCEQLVDWATRVGHRRIWLDRRVVDLQNELPGIGPVATTCTCCGARWQEDSWDFWSSVVGYGNFPYTCPICGSFMPQWQPEPDTGGRAWDSEFDGLASTLETEGGWG